jgi:hypothetical protein
LHICIQAKAQAGGLLHMPFQEVQNNTEIVRMIPFKQFHRHRHPELLAAQPRLVPVPRMLLHTARGVCNTTALRRTDLIVHAHTRRPSAIVMSVIGFIFPTASACAAQQQAHVWKESWTLFIS